VTDTVERNILDLAVKQGLSLYTKENSVGLLNVSSLAIDTEKKGGGSTKKKVQKGDYIFEYALNISLFDDSLINRIKDR
jgi:E3 ubiquitin-protein ligase SHPRH